MTDSGKANKARSLRYRAQVVDYLRRAGLRHAASAPEPKGMTISELLRLDRGDIIGTPWVLGVRARERTLDLAGSLDAVRWRAENAGNPLFASVQLRRGHPDVADSYVTMSLATFTVSLLATEAPGGNR